MDAKIIAGILAAGGAALAAGGVYRIRKLVTSKKETPSGTMFPGSRLKRRVR